MTKYVLLPKDKVLFRRKVFVIVALITNILLVTSILLHHFNYIGLCTYNFIYNTVFLSLVFVLIYIIFPLLFNSNMKEVERDE